MRRVVITGLGVVSSIGNSKKEVFYSLYNGISGITFSKEMKKLGMKSQVWGNIKLKNSEKISRKIARFMNNSSKYAFFAMEKAIKDANLHTTQYQKNSRVGLIAGSGCSSSEYQNTFCNVTKRISSVNAISPYSAIRSMHSNISACLSTQFQIYGVNYSISSACATSAHCIGHAYQLIQCGKQDLIFAGGAEEVSCDLARKFDTMRVLSKKFNHDPIKASCVYDINRDGFVISGGSGILVIEDLSCALSRSANIYAEIIGYSSTSDGVNMVCPSGDGAVRCMSSAIQDSKNISIDYLNVHGTSTKIGDLIELKAIKKVFLNKKKPMISAIKSITGHSLGASGVHEIIYILLMLKYNFIAPSINIKTIENYALDMNIVQKTMNMKIKTAMSNSFGFGGTNVSLIVRRY